MEEIAPVEAPYGELVRRVSTQQVPGVRAAISLFCMRRYVTVRRFCQDRFLCGVSPAAAAIACSGELYALARVDERTIGKQQQKLYRSAPGTYGSGPRRSRLDRDDLQRTVFVQTSSQRVGFLATGLSPERFLSALCVCFGFQQRPSGT